MERSCPFFAYYTINDLYKRNYKNVFHKISSKFIGWHPTTDISQITHVNNYQKYIIQMKFWEAAF